MAQVLPYENFRVRENAALLKVEDVPEMDELNNVFPRSRERGPIEDRCLRASGRSLQNFRVRENAALLKKLSS